MINLHQFYCILNFLNILTRHCISKYPVGCQTINNKLDISWSFDCKSSRDCWLFHLTHTHLVLAGTVKFYYTVLVWSHDSVWSETRASEANVRSQSGDSFCTCWITTKMRYTGMKRFQEKRHNQKGISYSLSRPATDTLKSIFPGQTGRRQGSLHGANLCLNIS